MAEDIIDLERQIFSKRNDWIRARSDELQGIGSAGKVKEIDDQIRVLEARKTSLEVENRELTQERKQNMGRNQMTRQRRLNRDR